MESMTELAGMEVTYRIIGLLLAEIQDELSQSWLNFTLKLRINLKRSR